MRLVASPLAILTAFILSSAELTKQNLRCFKTTDFNPFGVRYARRYRDGLDNPWQHNWPPSYSQTWPCGFTLCRISMPRPAKTCYWCGAPAISAEHAPPRNLFPSGEDLRLVTVPSCKAHNEDFHLLDERFRVYLQGTSNSEIAATLFGDKTLRGLTLKPGLINSISAASVPAIFEGEKTRAISISSADHDAYIEKITRALYFHHFRERYQGTIRGACSHFHSDKLDFRQLILLYHSVSPSLTVGQNAHPDIFRYEIGRAIEPGGTGMFLRATFYGDITVFVLGTP